MGGGCSCEDTTSCPPYAAGSQGALETCYLFSSLWMTPGGRGCFVLFCCTLLVVVQHVKTTCDTYNIHTYIAAGRVRIIRVLGGECQKVHLLFSHLVKSKIFWDFHCCCVPAHSRIFTKKAACPTRTPKPCCVSAQQIVEPRLFLAKPSSCV